MKMAEGKIKCERDESFEQVFGNIFAVESMATHDGDGIRYCVFLHGCPLRCLYCHNIEAWCADEFEVVSAQKLFEKILRYKPYFGERGGVTFSGGEPLLQARFINKMAELFKREGIRYIIDTSLSVKLDENVEVAILGADKIIADLKMPNQEQYEELTKGDFSLVKEGFKFLKENKIPTLIRTVIVENLNDSEGCLEQYANFVKGMDMIVDYELLPFSTLGFKKYERYQMENKLKDKRGYPMQSLQALQAKLIEKIQGAKKN